jgi:hypothetical protein
VLLACHSGWVLSSTPMLRFARSLLQPAPTSPLDPYRWRNDNRSTGEKAASGARLGFGLVAGFLVLLLAIGGISAVSAGSFAYGRHGPLVSWSMVCLSAFILFLTANRWASIGPGFFCVPGFFKSLAVLIFGTYPSSSISYHRITRTQAGEILLVCIIVIGSTWRFARNHPAPTTFIDRIALTFFVLATIRQIVMPDTWPPWPLISALCALLIAWCVYRWEHTRGRKHHHGSTP